MFPSPVSSIEDLEKQNVYLLYVANAGPIVRKFDKADSSNPWGNDLTPLPTGEYTNTDYKKNNILIINSASCWPVGIIKWEPGVRPFWIDMDDKGILYVVDNENIVTVIDTGQQNKIISTISMEEGFIMDMALEDRGNRLFCAIGGASSVGVINTETHCFIKNIPLPRLEDGSIGQPWGIAVKDNFVYVATGRPTIGEVVFINSNVYCIEATVTVGTNPFGIAVTPDGKKLYVANQDSANVSVIDTNSRKVTATVEAGYLPTGVAITPDGNKALVSNRGSNSVTIIDTLTDKVLVTVATGKEPVGIAISKDGKMAFVANSASDDVTMIDLERNCVTGNTWPFHGGKPIDLVLK